MPWKQKRKKRLKMSEVIAEVVKEKVDEANDIRLEITRPADGQTLQIFIKAPTLAEVIRKMAPGNFKKDQYADIYKPILLDLEADKTRCITRPAIARATKNIVGGTDFSFAEPPRGILLANPDKLAAGFSITYKVDQPIPPDAMRKWGKQFMEGCKDILANARPFKMAWVMAEVGK